MRLSKLQKYILETCCRNKNNSCLKVDLYSFYPKSELEKNKIGVQVGIQKSIDNLVAKDFIIAFGHKTAKKWTIEKTKLTAKGKKIARMLIKKKQQKLKI